MPFLRGREVIVEMRAEMIPKARFSRKCPRPRRQSAAGSEGQCRCAARDNAKSLSGSVAQAVHCLGRCPRRLSEALPEAIRSYARGAGQSGRVDK